MSTALSQRVGVRLPQGQRIGVQSEAGESRLALGSQRPFLLAIPEHVVERQRVTVYRAARDRPERLVREVLHGRQLVLDGLGKIRLWRRGQAAGECPNDDRIHRLGGRVGALLQPGIQPAALIPVSSPVR